MNIKKTVLSQILMIILLMAIMMYLLFSLDLNHSNFAIISGFIIIGVLSFYGIIDDVKIISINKVYWYFQLLFMSLAPLCQYLSQYYPWGINISDDDLLSAQMIVILWNSFYLFFYKIKIKRRNGRIKRLLLKKRYYSNEYLFILLLFALICFASFVVLVGSIQALFIRDDNQLAIEDSTINFIVRKFLTAVPAACCSIFFLARKPKGTFIRLGLAILYALNVLSNFPTSTTRYWMGTLLLGAPLVGLLSRRNSRVVDIAIIVVMIVVFPLFYIFKYHTLVEVLSGGFEYGGMLECFNTVDFDAFTIVARAVRYVRENGMTWGRQLINVVFFFVPRKIWIDKPLPTNTIIAESQHQSFPNISCPLPAEGYINFGLVGVLFYAFIFARFCKYLDLMWWNKSKDNESNVINELYPFLCIVVMYVCRGPLQPCFVQTIALIMPTIVLNIRRSIAKHE